MTQDPLGVPSTLDTPARIEQLEARVALLEQLLAARAPASKPTGRPAGLYRVQQGEYDQTMLFCGVADLLGLAVTTTRCLLYGESKVKKKMRVYSDSPLFNPSMCEGGRRSYDATVIITKAVN